MDKERKSTHKISSGYWKNIVLILTILPKSVWLACIAILYITQDPNRLIIVVLLALPIYIWLIEIYLITYIEGRFISKKNTVDNSHC